MTNAERYRAQRQAAREYHRARRQTVALVAAEVPIDTAARLDAAAAQAGLSRSAMLGRALTAYLDGYRPPMPPEDGDAVARAAARAI